MRTTEKQIKLFHPKEKSTYISFNAQVMNSSHALEKSCYVECKKCKNGPNQKNLNKICQTSIKDYNFCQS